MINDVVAPDVRHHGLEESVRLDQRMGLQNLDETSQRDTSMTDRLTPAGAERLMIPLKDKFTDTHFFGRLKKVGRGSEAGVQQVRGGVRLALRAHHAKCH